MGLPFGRRPTMGRPLIPKETLSLRPRVPKVTLGRRPTVGRPTIPNVIMFGRHPMMVRPPIPKDTHGRCLKLATIGRRPTIPVVMLILKEVTLGPSPLISKVMLGRHPTMSRPTIPNVMLGHRPSQASRANVQLPS
jgi:hypothetical protein